MSEYHKNQKVKKEGDQSGLNRVTTSFIQEVERLEKQVLKVGASAVEMGADELIETLLTLDDLELQFQQMLQMRNAVPMKN